MEQNKIVLFDIDYTIFNAQSYRNVFQEALYNELGTGLSKDEFSEIANDAYTETKNQTGHFDPDALIHILALRLKKSVDLAKLTKVVVNDDFIQSSLYDESVEVFKILSKDPSLTLGIFSAGRIDIQRSKIRSIEEYLSTEHIHIFEYKKLHGLPDLLTRYRQNDLYIIDDILSILAEAKKLYNGVTTIWIKRGIYKDKTIADFKPDFAIENLKEVIPILQK